MQAKTAAAAAASGDNGSDGGCGGRFVFPFVAKCRLRWC